MGIIEQIKSAASIAELQRLNDKLKSYKDASPRTIRRAARAAQKRQAELK